MGWWRCRKTPRRKKQLIEQPEVIKTRSKKSCDMKARTSSANRMTTEQVELGGVTLAAGTPVTLCIGAAKPRPPPISRSGNARHARTPNGISPLHGAHQCAGMALARLEGAIAISRFLKRFPGYTLNGPPYAAAASASADF